MEGRAVVLSLLQPWGTLVCGLPELSSLSISLKNFGAATRADHEILLVQFQNKFLYYRAITYYGVRYEVSYLERVSTEEENTKNIVIVRFDRESRGIHSYDSCLTACAYRRNGNPHFLTPMKTEKTSNYGMGQTTSIIWPGLVSKFFRFCLPPMRFSNHPLLLPLAS